MSNLASSEKNLMSQPKLFKNGQIMVTLKALKSKIRTEDYSITKASSITSGSKTKKTSKSGKNSVMLESLPLTKKKIWSDKLNFSKNNIQSTKLSKTLAPASTGKERVSFPFWNKSSMEMSKKLWLPTKTDCQDLALGSYIGCSKNLTANSWFSTKLQKPIQKLKSPKMSSRSSTISSPKIMVKDLPRIEKKEIFRSRKIKLYPTILQKQILNEWFGACRWVYNQCTNYCNNTKSCPSKKILRSKFINGNQFSQFAKSTPFDVRDESMSDVLKNMRSNFAKMKKQNNKFRFDLKYRKKKNSQSISIRARHYGRKTGKYAWLTEINKSEKIEIIPNDFRIVRDICGDYFICLPRVSQSRSERQAYRFTSTNPMVGIIALDPGVRTFMTGYDPYRKNIVHLGNNVSDVLNRYSKTLDILSRRIDNTSSRMKKRNYKRVRRRIYRKIKNMINDLHHKIAKFLCRNYRTILLPKFRTKNMSQNSDGGRKISKKTTRNMLGLSHFKFQQILLSKSEEYKNCQVEIVTEEYTSKTCGNCGTIHDKLGANKTFICPKCNSEMDRDGNAARNILLKAVCE